MYWFDCERRIKSVRVLYRWVKEILRVAVKAYG